MKALLVAVMAIVLLGLWVSSCDGSDDEDVDECAGLYMTDHKAYDEGKYHYLGCY